MTRLHKFHQLPQLEVELPYTELFGSPSPVYNEELVEDCGYVVESPGQASSSLASDTASSDWEWMQEYGDISYALENCPGVYERCININDICCKNDRQLTGPTLAELNEIRALSPLINPDMKRLHLVATKVENDKLEQFSECNGNRPNRSYLSELNRPIPKKLSAQEPVVPISQMKNENIPTNLRRMLLYGANRPGALNSTVSPEKSNRKELNEARELKNSTEKTSHSSEEKESAEVLGKSLPSDAESVSDISDRESAIADDEDMSSGSDEDDEEDDEATPTKRFGSSRKRKRSEAEDMTPNPKKLYEIGKQLEKLNRIINGLRPMNQSSINAKNKTRREKNKLASRACRLKKKAGHEANKIKFSGLNQENKCLTDLIHEVKELLIRNLKEDVPKHSWLLLERKIDNSLENQVAGKVSEYVDSTLFELNESTKMAGTPK
ncbi:uncharacterized protein LOC135695951 [Rhopilema esculentum]|uniref:uncharacterized protein LOC135695951 n=1 Tax=Rhopilema esculentum TaxID=499914 RepID=UPI0031D2CF12